MLRSAATFPLLRVFTLTLVVLGCGCAGTGPGTGAPVHYRFFDPPDSNDIWTPTIRGWQSRERALTDTELLRPTEASLGARVSEGGGATIGSGGTHGDLRAEYFAFRAERKRALARDVAAWIQSEARHHYIPNGPIARWATLEETLANNGASCNGLELLPNRFLLDAGFRPDEVYRAIVMRPSDGQHHMVTLWFENPDDPWVIDPTGAMTTGMPHLSEVAGWVPVKVFSEYVEYTVHPDTVAPGSLAIRQAR
ncbi:MAG TPA: hypothetical protein VEG67_00015 [Myxococcota bacterium]|nr:hypothetical protein [Myxococcota bacterium]